MIMKQPFSFRISRNLLHGVLALFVLALAFGCAAKQPVQTALPEEEALDIATQAYVFGYPLVTMDMTRRVMTNAATTKGTHGPMNQFVNMRSYPSASFRDVTAPNADTLYSSAWLDLSKEPYVLSLPDMKGRYFLMPMLSGWTDVIASPGKRTTGTKAQNIAITGPDFKGSLPEGVTQVKSPTNMLWILGRTYCTGTAADYKAVHALQDKYALVPLSSYGKPYTPPAGVVNPAIDMKTPVRDQVNALPIDTYFNLLARLMKDNPPAAADAPMLAKMAKIGLVPGQEFDLSKLPKSCVAKLADIPKNVVTKLMDFQGQNENVVNGWMIYNNLGTYGTKYSLRAKVTIVGLGANLPQDAIYPMHVNAPGQKLTGADSYVMHFDKGMLPPVDGFWSLTMYDKDYFFVDNPLNRYTLSPRDKLKVNKDGSVDLYLQKDNPGKAKQSNWLPAPAGEMNLMLRLYWPKATPPSILDGSWAPPAVTKAQ